MRLEVLGTGSKGNCYVIRSEDGSTVLLDVGIPYKDILKGLNFDLGSLKGFVLTHSHQDHSRSVKDFASLGFKPLPTWGVAGDWRTAAFKVHHDVECFGYQLINRETGHKIIYATDTYHLPYIFKGVTHYIVECNYIADLMLKNIHEGRSPASIKDRVIYSHMSLETLKDFFREQDLSICQKIILVHLSDTNSDEDRMVKEIQEVTGIETVAATNGAIIDLDLFPF